MDQTLTQFQYKCVEHNFLHFTLNSNITIFTQYVSKIYLDLSILKCLHFVQQCSECYEYLVKRDSYRFPPRGRCFGNMRNPGGFGSQQAAERKSSGSSIRLESMFDVNVNVEGVFFFFLQNSFSCKVHLKHDFCMWFWTSKLDMKPQTSWTWFQNFQLKMEIKL